MSCQTRVGQKEVSLADVSMPVLSVSAAKDTIAPADAVDAISLIVPQTEVLRLPGGHVGIVAGRSALTLWERTVKFLGTSHGEA
jgi:poly(3-hydroxyalkanoate) synthetase